jgi:hypothetical protein
MVPVELLWRGMSLVVMLAALVPFRPSTVVHVIETPHPARFLVGRQAFLLLDSEAGKMRFRLLSEYPPLKKRGTSRSNTLRKEKAGSELPDTLIRTANTGPKNPVINAITSSRSI